MKLKRFFTAFVAVAVAVSVCGIFYVKTHPLVFNESFFEHSHCMVLTGTAFNNYAADHFGHFPFATNGYGNALLLLSNYVGDNLACLTGPGYDSQVFANAKTDQRIPEQLCGRVYVQGLCETNDPRIGLFFDKLPTPGGDHCHGIHRIFAPLAREVWTIGDDRRVVKEMDWNQFAKQQVELLVIAGIARPVAQGYYFEKAQK